MSEHTKRPWLVRPTGDEHGQWSEVIAMDAGPFDAATGICETYREEDARLIAAAPGMLSELIHAHQDAQAVYAMLGHEPQGDYMPIQAACRKLDNLMARIDDVIAKATGSEVSA